MLSYTIAEDTKGETKNRDIEITKGEYMGQKWHIDKNHILYWDGEPYIPHAINDFPLLNKEIDEQIKGIDFLFDNGITDFILGSYEPDWIDLKNNYYNKAKREKLNANLRKVIKHIEKRGGTFIFSYYLNNVVKHLLGGYPSIDFMLNKDTQNAIRDDVREYAKVISSPALRAFELSQELNGLDAIYDYVDRLYKDLDKVLDVYGRIVKEEVGNVPVIFRLERPIGLNKNKFEKSYISNLFLPYLSGLYVENIDGIIMQYHGIMPQEVKFHAQQVSIITRVLNSCSKTKLNWGYAQAVAAGFTLYQSKQLMKDSYQEMIDVGVTGFPYDQFSSSGMIEFGFKPSSREERNQNSKWWGQLKPELRANVLEYARLNKFLSGKWASLPTDKDLKLKSAKVLTSKEVTEIARKHPSVKKILLLGAILNELIFNPDYGLWSIFISRKDGEGLWFMWIRDSEDGEVVLNGIKLLEDAREAGYPIPSDEWLLGFSDGEKGDDTNFKSSGNQIDQERIEELERALKEAQEQDNQQEIKEIRELLRKLEIDNKRR
ncbi:MAG: hypothetical protein AABX63_00620 [Nanoarchaeota archaeon]